MNEDAVLLRRYVENSNEEAFTRLVHKYIDLVYAAALRRTGGDPHRAADVAQEVFTALARQARKLSQHPALSAWLHTATRNVAVNLVMSDQRRQQRQLTALEVETTLATSAAPDWERLRPVLDAAIDELPEPDRLAVVQRFLERRAFAEIGAALGVFEDSARMRTDRALDKLRALLGRRGIASTAAALGAAVASHAEGIAPAGLATALAAKSLAAASGGTGLLAAVTAFMSMKIVTTAVVSALIAFLAGSYVSGSRAASTAPAAPAVVARTADTDAALRTENQRLLGEVAQLNAELRTLNTTQARLLEERAATAAESRRTPGIIGVQLPRHELQRLILNNLRQIAAARDQFILENKRSPANIHELVGATAYIRRARPVDGEDYAILSLKEGAPLTLTTANGVTVTYDPEGGTTTQIETPPVVALTEELGKKVKASLQAATEAYRLANQGRDPKNEQALLPFFSTPQEGADFVDYLEAKKVASKIY
ncbi:MAG: RNA polymerase sigma factor [Opitutus sp.]|nr:RNA polymerase sigma factor [Opitutus sp.]